MRSHPSCRNPFTVIIIEKLILIIRTNEIIAITGSEHNLFDAMGSAQIKPCPATRRLSKIKRGIGIAIKHISVLMRTIQSICSGCTDYLSRQGNTVGRRCIESSFRNITITIFRTILANITVSMVTIYPYHIPKPFGEFLDDKKRIFLTKMKVIATFEHTIYHPPHKRFEV